VHRRFFRSAIRHWHYEAKIIKKWTRGRIYAESYGFTVEEIGRLTPQYAWSKRADISPSILSKLALFGGFLPHLSPLGVTSRLMCGFPGPEVLLNKTLCRTVISCSNAPAGPKCSCEGQKAGKYFRCRLKSENAYAADYLHNAYNKRFNKGIELIR
jgi:hypothetical protein